MKATIIVTSIIAVLAVFGISLVRASAPNENERKLDDEEQMEWIRKWREEHDGHKKHTRDD